MMASTINNPFMAEYARIKSKQIEEIENSLALCDDTLNDAERGK
jgi:hypothetical protein